MTFDPDRLVKNAQSGTGPCKGCPANEDTGGAFVNPGLINPDADLMFLTIDPSHTINWDRHSDWKAYNRETSELFIHQWPGGQAISSILKDIEAYDITDVWLADAIKCPVNNDLAGDVDENEAFAHCSEYLKEEIETINPKVIVTLGNDPAEQVLQGVFNESVRAIKAGSRHCGKIFETSPPVVISPHWAHGWLRRGNNRKKVVESIRQVLESDTVKVSTPSSSSKLQIDRNSNQNNSADQKTMTRKFPRTNFRTAYRETMEYKTRGKRAENNGVPTRPTLARYATKEALGYDPFGSPIRNNTQTVLATILKLAAGLDRSIDEIVEFVSDKETLKKLAQGYVHIKYPGSASLVEHFDHVDYTGPVIVAICAAEYDIDPIIATRNHLDGETRYRIVD